MPRKQLIQKRRDTAANWVNINPILADGEEGYETDTKQSKVGNGVSVWTALSYVNTSGKVVVKTVGVLGSGADYEIDGTDDHVQINLAINAANAAGGGEVRLLPGDYYAGTLGSTHITLKSNVTLRGSGKGITRIHSKATIYSESATAAGVISTTYDGTVSKTTLTNIHVSDMTVFTYGYGITMFNTDKTSVKNVDLRPETGLTPQIRAHVRFLYCQNVLLENSDGYNAGGNTFNINACDYFKIDKCNVYSTYDDGFDIDYNFLFVGGTINHVATPSRWGSITNSNVYGTQNLGTGIRVENSYDVLVLSNYIEGAVTAGVWVGCDYRVTGVTTSRVKVLNNTARNCKYAGFRTDITNSVANTVDYIEFKNNTAINCGDNTNTAYSLQGGFVFEAPITANTPPMIVENNLAYGTIKQTDSGGFVIYKINNVRLENNRSYASPYAIHLWNGDNATTYSNIVIANNEVSSTAADYFGANNALTQAGVNLIYKFSIDGGTV